jgi:hypothetical protein
MIFRLSAKLATKLKVSLESTSPFDPDPFADWSGHLFAVDRVQYLIFSNTASLYSTVFLGRGITNFDQFRDGAVTSIRKTLQQDELADIAERIQRSSAVAARTSKALNRSIVASINDLVFHAKFCILQRQASLLDTCNKLNDMPLGTFNYKSAREVIRSLAIEVKSSK